MSQSADISSSFGYGLSLTATHAMVWPYNSTSQSPETFVFTLPSASKPTDPLPVGSLVSPSASSTEPGLVVVMAGSGKVVFWESISSAATFAFIKKDRSGVEHMISGMGSGEKVVGITNAESAGFILTFNTGRLAYMSVRDNHGRPAILVQFLRTNLSSASGGIFGSIRNAFSHLSLRGEIAAVRADRSARVGERNVVALTGRGKLQAWKVHRGGHNEVIGDADIREQLISVLQETDPVTTDFAPESMEALDFTFVPRGLDAKYLELSRLSDAIRSDDSMAQHLLLLVGFTRKNISRYAMVEVILKPKGCKIGMVRPITSYSTPISQKDTPESSRPRLYLPRPALVAFAIFERATVIASIANPPESPDYQLQSDSHILPASFEDVIDFREDNTHEIVGSGFEEMASATQEEGKIFKQKPKNPTSLLMVRGAGVIRVVTTDVDKFASDQPPKVSAKSKLEQTVFFGAKPDNPLIFDGRREISFSDRELSQAALEISQEILSSSTTYISTLPASLEENLVARSDALERLMLHLRSIGAELDRVTRWSLLYNAEKMHVATLLWKRHEAFTAARPADDKLSLIGNIVQFIHEDQKTNPLPSAGQVDPIRHWFMNDVFRLELFVAWAYEIIKTLYKDHLVDDTKVTLLIHEAMQINIDTHVGAMEFRKSNLSFYGLGNEKLRMGILKDGYEGLPEPWTGSQYVANNAKRLVDLSEQWYKKYHGVLTEKTKDASKPDSKLVEHIYENLSVLTDGMLTSILECARWGLASSDQKTMAQNFAKVYQADRHDKPIALAKIGQWEEAGKIAEKHDSLSALAVILLDFIENLEAKLAEPSLSPVESQKLKTVREFKKTELEDRFSKYGKDFAFAVYEYLLEKHGVEAVLEFDLETLGFKTQFLRSKPELARISWINDVEQEKDIDHAAETLVSLALHNEQQTWNKKIELSLGKLAMLAEAETRASGPGGLKVKGDDARFEEQLQKIDRELITVRIQDQLYGEILPTTFDAVDEAAALNLAMEAHSGNIPKRQKALLQVFEGGMERLLKHETLDAMTLIDLLTLVSLKEESRENIADPFWLALKVAESSCQANESRDAKRLIWRRMFIRDAWSKLNDTNLKDDREVMDAMSQTELFALLADCVRFQSEHAEFHPMRPQEAMGAFTESLDRRFDNVGADFQAKVADCMKWEDKELKKNIDKHRLPEWLRTTLDAARVEVKTMAESERLEDTDLANGMAVEN